MTRVERAVVILTIIGITWILAEIPQLPFAVHAYDQEERAPE